MVTPYCPALGDVIWIDFEPQAGREMMKRRPALVLSSTRYNQRSGLCLLCPITSRLKGYSYEVPIDTRDTSGAVLSDQVKSFDWQQCNAARIGRAPAELMDVVRENIAALMEIS